MQYSAKTKLQEARKVCSVFSNLSCATVRTTKKKMCGTCRETGGSPKTPNLTRL